MYVRTSLNSWGAEVRAVMGIGDKRDFGVQFWQPLGAGSKWYVAPSLQYGSSSGDMFSGRPAPERASATTCAAPASRSGASWATGATCRSASRASSAGTRVVVPEQPDTATEHAYDTTQFLRYRVDTLDSLGFPSRGCCSTPRSSARRPAATTASRWPARRWWRWRRCIPRTGPATCTANGRTPRAARRRSAWAASCACPAPRPIRCRAAPSRFARLVLARRIGALPVTLGGTVRAGFSLEAGGGFDQDLPLLQQQRAQAGRQRLPVGRHALRPGLPGRRRHARRQPHAVPVPRADLVGAAPITQAACRLTIQRAAYIGDVMVAWSPE